MDPMGRLPFSTTGVPQFTFPKFGKDSKFARLVKVSRYAWWPTRTAAMGRVPQPFSTRNSRRKFEVSILITMNQISTSPRFSSILIAGHLGSLLPQTLAKSGHRVRHVYRVPDAVVAFAIVDHFPDCWQFTSTHSAAQACDGLWTDVIAVASMVNPAKMGKSGSEALRGAWHALKKCRIHLIPHTACPNWVPLVLGSLN